MDDLGSFWGFLERPLRWLLWFFGCVLAVSSGVPVVTDEALLSGSDGENVEPHSFFSLQRASSVKKT